MKRYIVDENTETKITLNATLFEIQSDGTLLFHGDKSDRVAAFAHCKWTSVRELPQPPAPLIPPGQCYVVGEAGVEAFFPNAEETANLQAAVPGTVINHRPTKRMTGAEVEAFPREATTSIYWNLADEVNHLRLRVAELERPNMKPAQEKQS